MRRVVLGGDRGADHGADRPADHVGRRLELERRDERARLFFCFFVFFVGLFLFSLCEGVGCVGRGASRGVARRTHTGSITSARTHSTRTHTCLAMWSMVSGAGAAASIVSPLVVCARAGGGAFEKGALVFPLPLPP